MREVVPTHSPPRTPPPSLGRVPPVPRGGQLIPWGGWESSTPGLAGGRPPLSSGLCNKGGSLKIDFELQCRKGSETYRAGVCLSYTPCV